MSRRTAILLAALAALAIGATGTIGPVMARGAPPVSQVPATAPGGTEGRAGPQNIADAIRGGNAYGLPRNAGQPRPYDPGYRLQPLRY